MNKHGTLHNVNLPLKLSSHDAVESIKTEMGSYNYEALHRHTPGMKRAWPAAAAPRDVYLNGFHPDPLTNGYGELFLERLMHPCPNGLPLVGAGVMPDRYFNKYDNIPTNRFAANGLSPANYMGLLEAERFAPMYAGNGMYVRDAMREPIIRELSPSPPRLSQQRHMATSNVNIQREPPPEAPPSPLDPLEDREPALPGMIFGCTSETYVECMQLKLFALPATNKSQVGIR